MVSNPTMVIGDVRKSIQAITAHKKTPFLTGMVTINLRELSL